MPIDRSGDLYIIELKRDQLPREALAQAIDYASDVQSWSLERISEICSNYTNQSLEDLFNDAFPEADIESIKINDTQRILLVGFSLDSALERMIEWLSEQYGVGINAVILKYIRTSSGAEVLRRPRFYPKSWRKREYARRSSRFRPLTNLARIKSRTYGGS